VWQTGCAWEHGACRIRLANDLLGSPAVHIWVDADACPKVIKDLLVRAADRRKIALTLVANQPLSTPPSPLITALRVPAGFDGCRAAPIHVGTITITDHL
jgi:hypothetical protein